MNIGDYGSINAVVVVSRERNVVGIGGGGDEIGIGGGGDEIGVDGVVRMPFDNEPALLDEGLVLPEGKGFNPCNCGVGEGNRDPAVAGDPGAGGQTEKVVGRWRQEGVLQKLDVGTEFQADMIVVRDGAPVTRVAGLSVGEAPWVAGNMLRQRTASATMCATKSLEIRQKGRPWTQARRHSLMVRIERSILPT
jgi:hypothetical protein